MSALRRSSANGEERTGEKDLFPPKQQPQRRVYFSFSAEDPLPEEQRFSLSRPLRSAGAAEEGYAAADAVGLRELVDGLEGSGCSGDPES